MELGTRVKVWIHIKHQVIRDLGLGGQWDRAYCVILTGSMVMNCMN